MKWTLLLGPFDLEIVKQRQVKISKIRVSKLYIHLGLATVKFTANLSL